MMRSRPLLAAVAVLALAGCSAPDAPTSAEQAAPPPLAAVPAGPGYTDRVDPEWARATAESTGIPLLALTAYARTEDRMRALMAGFQMHTVKPVETVELLTMVASLAGRTGG